MHVHLARRLDLAEQLDAAAAVDEVEEDELAHVAPREHTAREAPRLLAFHVVLERVRLGVDGGDLVPVGKALGGHGDLTIAQAFGPSSGVRPWRTTENPFAS